MLFDPILDIMIHEFTEFELVVEDTDETTFKLSQSIACAHCYRPIVGKFHRDGDKYYDDYCWQFRYVIGTSLSKTRDHPEHHT
jgi:hypothetical protein